MKVLILGGTGAIGVHLVELLAQQKIDIFITSRRYRENRNNITYLQGDAKQSHFLKIVLNNKWDAVIDFMTYSTLEFKTRLEQLLNSTDQYIFLSSARVYAETEKPLKEDSSRLLDVTSDSEYLKSDEYALAKARQEDLLIHSGKKNWTIIRPYITYEQNRLQLGVLEKEAWLYRALKGRTIVFSKDIINKRTTMTHGYNVSLGIFSIIGSKQAHENTYHITSNQSTSWERVLNIYLKTLERHLGYLPKVKLENLQNFTVVHPAKYQVKYDRIFNRTFDNSKIRQIIDVNSFADIEKRLPQSLEAFLSNPKFKTINWPLEAIKDKLCNEKTPLSEIKGFKNKLKYTSYRYLPQHLINSLKKFKT